MATTPRITLASVTHTIAFAIRMNSGPYGAGVCCHTQLTFSLSVLCSTAGPTTYGS